MAQWFETYRDPNAPPETINALASLIGDAKYWQISETPWYKREIVDIKRVYAKFYAPGHPEYDAVTVVKRELTAKGDILSLTKRYLIDHIFNCWRQSIKASYPNHPDVNWAALKETIIKGFELKEDSVCISPEAGTPSEAIASGTSSADANSAN